MDFEVRKCKIQHFLRKRDTRKKIWHWSVEIVVKIMSNEAKWEDKKARHWWVLYTVFRGLDFLLEEVGKWKWKWLNMAETWQILV